MSYTDELIAEIREMHERQERHEGEPALCLACSPADWPCDAVRAADALEAATRERDAALACIADLEVALIAEAAKLRGREPIAIRLDEACDVAPGGRPCENRKAGHKVHFSNKAATDE